jgi:ribosomal protein S18 acetylase RimI-like enzyme
VATRRRRRPTVNVDAAPAGAQRQRATVRAGTGDDERTDIVADAGVRAARPEDIERIGELQAQAWRAAYAGLLPAQTLDALQPAELAAAWEASLTAPPTPRHRVLSAYDADGVVGFCAFGPATDRDLEPDVDADLGALVVAGGSRHSGHGSRLLAAAVEHLTADGFSRAHMWLAEADAQLTAFLTGAGWAPDGARRTLDLQGDGTVLIEQSRLHTDISGAGT